MSISCQICQQNFAKIIPWQHLKTHNITSTAYKQQYGQLYSDSTLELFKKRIPHNKGKKVSDSDQLKKIREAIQHREQKYQKGQLTRQKKPCDSLVKTKISESLKDYAKSHKSELTQRAQKALETKRIRGSLIGPMKGKKHSENTKKKLKALLSDYNQTKKLASWNKIQESAVKAQLSISQDLGTSLQLQCLNCEKSFCFTKQYFNTAKFRPDLCPYCYPPSQQKISKGQQELFDFIKLLCPTAVQNHRTHYHSPEIDIFIPDRQLGIEFHGLYWHSESVLLANNKSPKNDYLKYCHWQEQSVRLVQIYEDEWNDKKSIVKSRLTHICGKITEKISARKCVIREISSDQASAFFNNTHIMGNGRSNFRIGLFFNDQLISAMSFSKNNLSRKIDCWELNRFSSLPNVLVMGGANKLFSYFIKIIQPSKIVSYSDNRWSQGQIYKKMGFEKISSGTPNYWYFLPNQNRIHRFNLRKNSHDDPAKSEIENRSAQGYNRIWDSGSTKWIWSK